MKVWCLKCFICTNSSDEQSAFVRLYKHTIYSFFEFALKWIPAIRKKAELSSIQKITFITATADKKIISVLCLSGGNVLRASVWFSN